MSDLKQYKCPSCGGNLVFNIEAQKMNCIFCKNDYKPEDIKAVEEFSGKDNLDDSYFDNNARAWRDEELKGKKIYSCQSCGGEIICDEITASANCPYCDSKVVMVGQFKGGDKPDIIIPFKIEKKKAIEIFKNRIKSKSLIAPSKFKKGSKINEIKGVYVPFWLFDAKTTGQAKFSAQKIRKSSTDSYDYEEINHFILLREGEAEFENVPVDGSSKIDDALMESIEPFNLDEAIDFDTMYLSGYMADKYDEKKEDVINNANERLRASMAETLSEQAGKRYDEFNTEQCYIQIENGNSKYAFYPVWLLNIKWKNKNYQFAINGQTGKLAGYFPRSLMTVIMWCLLYWAGVGSVIYLITYIIMFLL